MIERERKRIKLHKKYSLKRASLLDKYENEEEKSNSRDKSGYPPL